LSQLYVLVNGKESSKECLDGVVLPLADKRHWLTHHTIDGYSRTPTPINPQIDMMPSRLDFEGAALPFSNAPSLLIIDKDLISTPLIRVGLLPC